MRHQASPEALLAPSAASGTSALRLPGATRAPSFPPLDERLVRPEATGISRREVVRGERMVAQPARPEHGDQHFGLDYVVGAHVRAGYVGSTDMLTRLGVGSDFATDTSIRRAGKDPSTGQRWLEEIAFEVVYEQTVKSITVRAQDLAARGVRRVFAIFVKKGEIKEWVPTPGAGAWRALDPGSTISDPTLVKPLAVQALLDGAVADDEVVRALDAKDNPAILAIKAESEARGEVREAAAAVLAVLAGRGLAVTEQVRTAVEGSANLAELRRWLIRAATATTTDDVLG